MVPVGNGGFSTGTTNIKCSALEKFCEIMELGTFELRKIYKMGQIIGFVPIGSGAGRILEERILFILKRFPPNSSM